MLGKTVTVRCSLRYTLMLMYNDYMGTECVHTGVHPDNDEILELDDSVLVRHMMNANRFDLHRDDACASLLPHIGSRPSVFKMTQLHKTQAVEVHHLLSRHRDSLSQIQEV